MFIQLAQLQRRNAPHLPAAKHAQQRFLRLFPFALPAIQVKQAQVGFARVFFALQVGGGGDGARHGGQMIQPSRLLQLALPFQILPQTEQIDAVGGLFRLGVGFRQHAQKGRQRHDVLKVVAQHVLESGQVAGFHGLEVAGGNLRAGNIVLAGIAQNAFLKAGKAAAAQPQLPCPAGGL